MNVFVVREIKDAFETVKDLEKKYTLIFLINIYKFLAELDGK